MVVVETANSLLIAVFSDYYNVTDEEKGEWEPGAQ